MSTAEFAGNSVPVKLLRDDGLHWRKVAAPMDDPSLLQFTIQASDRLQSVADDLCADSSCVQFCASLKVLLGDITRWLRTLPDDEHSESEAIALLEQLEGLCGPQHSLFCLSPPVGYSAALTAPKTRYVALAKLFNNLEALTRAARNLASDRRAQRQRRTTLAWLGSFLPQVSDDEKIDVSPSDADLRAASQAPPECGREIVTLYKTLFTHCFCAESERVVARIKLRNSVQDDSKVTFGVLFMAHPHQDGADLESQPLWQDTHISVLRTVNFDDNTWVKGEEIRLDSDTPFCSYISAHEEEGLILLKFSVTGQNLYFEESLDPERQWEFDRPTISLGRILEDVSVTTGDLTEKKKEVLSWLLAKAVWQYYSSPWMKSPWNKESVHFLFERQRTEDGHEVLGVFVNEPLLSVSIVSDASEDVNPKPSSEKKESTKCDPKRRRLPFFGRLLHPVPKILALGIMLVEIQLGRSIESLHNDREWSQYCPKGKPNANTNYKICKELIARQGFFSDVSDPLEALIRNCIQPNDLFTPPHVRDENGIREALYVLVNRLEIYLSKRKPYSVKPLNLSGNLHFNRPPFTKPSRHSRLPASLIPPRRRSRPGRTMAQITNSTTTKGWFKRMNSFNYILKAADDNSFNKVKIAVLDTGVDEHDVASVYISGYRDFVSGDDRVMCDNTGHGTTSINLIFDMCEMAKVYALRIFETDEANDKTRELAIKAIDWCIAEKMDVICMACGFNGFDQDLFEKIHEASGKMLIFAAPTNESNAGEIAYPARHDSEVFCMFSTNGAITTSQRLNPTRGLGLYNFAILGEDIVTLGGEVKSGTSFATAIAAGLAGRLLEFSDHDDCNDKIENSFMMKAKHGMTKILLAMAIKDGDFYCLKPWGLLPKNLRNQVPFEESSSPTEAEKREARDYICKVIMLSLADA